jgi:hypothetical protein
MSETMNAEERAKEVVSKGFVLFKERDWKGEAFTLPTGLVSSIWQVIAVEIEKAERAAARAERERCAKWHDEQRKKEMRLTRQDREDGFEEDGDIHENRALSHLRSAEAIRALPDEGEG